MKTKIGMISRSMLPILFIFSLGWLQKSPIAGAKSVADIPALSFQEVVSGLSSPVHVSNAGDGSGRLFIVEQAGKILIYKNSFQNQPFLDISDRVRSPASGGGNEEGLLSVAFPPGYGSKVKHFYVYYTNKNGDNQVSRFDVTATPDIADASTEKLVINFNHPTYTNHNGGQLAFGLDGYLYIGIGDGGGGGDPNKNAQNPGSLLGKIHRIDVELEQTLEFTPTAKIYFPLAAQGNPTSGQIDYRIPATNPFVGVEGHRPEIWAMGVRNPWRFSFDRLTGDLLIGDVGQNEREEVDYQPASSLGGENYGWNIMEGTACYNSASCDQTGLVLPVHDYLHVDSNCSITGGFVYRGTKIPGLQGVYLFADFCSGKVWGMQSNGSSWDVQPLAQLGLGITSFGEDEDGELYLAFRGQTDKVIYKIIQAPQ